MKRPLRDFQPVTVGCESWYTLRKNGGDPEDFIYVQLAGGDKYLLCA